MMRWLRKVFVSREEQGGEPHLLRSGVIATMLIVVISAHLFVLLSAFVISPQGSYIATLLPNVLVDLTNEQRETEKIGDLKFNAILAKAAELKAEDMAAKGYFSHNSPDGKTPWYWLKQVGYVYSYAGENLAVNFFDSQDVVDAWMKSPTHRANLLNEHFTEIGIATAKGTYEGRDGIFVVQFFGRPSVAKAATIPVEIKSVTTPKTTVKTTPVKVPVAAPIKVKTPVSTPTPPKPVVVPPAIVKPTSVPPVVTSTKVTAVNPDFAQIPPVVDSQLDSVKVAASSNPTDLPALTGTIEKLLVMPNGIAESLYLVIGAVILLSLFLHFLFSIRGVHRSATVNGAVLLVVISAVLFVDKLIVIVQAKVL